MRVLLVLAVVISLGVMGVMPAAAAGPLSVAPGGTDTGDCTTSACLTIGYAVLQAQAGDTINVAAGTYVEQLSITKPLTLEGAGAGTIIQSPDTLAVSFTTPKNIKAVVSVLNTAGVTIRDLVVDGAGKGNANNAFSGIAFRNAGGVVDNVEVKNIRDTPFSGVQHGVGIYAYNDGTASQNLEVVDCYIHDFQKNAMALNAADSSPMTVLVKGCTITGAGPTTVTAQNGIQVSGRMISGTVEENTVTGIGYNDPAWVATSILNFYANLDIRGNTVTGGHVGVYNIDAPARIVGNNLTMEKIGGCAYGIVASDPPQAVPSPFVDGKSSGGLSGGPGVMSLSTDPPLVVAVEGNTVSFNGSDNTSTFGIEADGGYSAFDLQFSANGNSVTGFQVGIEIWNCEGTGCLAGAFDSVAVHFNSLVDNTLFGLRSNLAYPIADATLNWWGAFDGPGGVGTGSGDAVSTNVTFDPWLRASDNGVALVPQTTGSLIVGDKVKVDVWATVITEPGAYGTEFAVTWLPTSGLSTTAAKVALGPWLHPDEVVQKSVTPGQVAIGYTQSAWYGSIPMTGSGVIATIEFTVDAAGTYPLTLQNVKLADPEGFAISPLTLTGWTITATSGASVSGTVTLQGRPNGGSGASVVVTDNVDTLNGVTTNGSFAMGLAHTRSGYTATASMYGYLPAAKSGLTLVDGNNALGTVKLLGGDVSSTGVGDAVIDTSDLTYMGTQYHTHEQKADVNGDGYVDILDLVLAGVNYGKSGTQVW